MIKKVFYLGLMTFMGCGSLREIPRQPAQVVSSSTVFFEQVKGWADPSFISKIDAKSCEIVFAGMNAQIETAMEKESEFELSLAAYSEFEDNNFKFRTKTLATTFPLPLECVKMFRKIVSNLRTMRDYAGEKLFAMKDEGFSQQLGAGYDLNTYPFRSGDILLTRGNSVLSSTISQISDNKNHFTHALFIYVDEKTKEAFTLESYPNKGAQIFPLKEGLKNDNLRILLLRPKDAEKAKAAVTFMYNKISNSLKLGKHIDYDYNYDAFDTERLSCVEVIQQAYQNTSQIQIPAFKSKILNANRTFLNGIGIKGGEFFVPADLETDPHFEEIFEWTVYNQVHDQRKQDRIVAKIFEWIGKDRYALQATNRSIVSRVLLRLRGMPVIWNLLSPRVGGDKIPRAIPPAILSAMVKLNDIGDLLLAIIHQKESTPPLLGRRLTEAEIDRLLEAYRAEDLEVFKTRGRGAELHVLLRPWSLKPAR